MVAQLLTRLHHTVDHALHPWRHDRVMRRLRATPPVREVLVVCHGNICRSPFAAERLGRALEGYGIVVRSAGFLGQGRPSPREAVTAAAERGVDLRDHRSRLVVPSLLGSAGLNVVMDGRQRSMLRFDFGFPGSRIVLLGDFDPGPALGRAIPDPWDRPLEEFRAVYARIDRCVGALATLLIAASAPSRRASPAARAPTQATAARVQSRNSSSPGLQSSHSNSS